jgi:Uncharacterised protein family (UPF0236).
LFSATVNENYDIDENTIKILNGDGAAWIKKSCEEDNVIFQLDPFHISQAITRKVENKKECEKLINLFKEGKSIEGLEEIKKLLIKYTDDENQFKKLEDLYNYLVSNKEALVPYKQRNDISLPTAPEGLQYNQLGTMESQIQNTLSRRMKGGKMSWSIKGADHLAKILAEKASKRLYETVEKIYNNFIPQAVLSETIKIVPLSASKVSSKVQEENVCSIKSVSIPFSSASITLGRKVIKELCSLKDFSDLSYI